MVSLVERTVLKQTVLKQTVLKQTVLKQTVLKRGALSFLSSVVLLALGMSSALANEQTFSCELDGEARDVVVSFGEENQLPCEVLYHKNGNAQTLWRASKQASYCGERAQELIAKLESNGWACHLDLAEIPHMDP